MLRKIKTLIAIWFWRMACRVWPEENGTVEASIDLRNAIIKFKYVNHTRGKSWLVDAFDDVARIKPKACPFCGSHTKVTNHEHIGNNPKMTRECDMCGTVVIVQENIGDNEQFVFDRLISKWNSRAAGPSTPNPNG